MKPIQIIWTVILGIPAIAILAYSMPAQVKNTSDIKTVVEGNNLFALDLYGQLKQAEGNLFFSPCSISTALAMTYAGARGNTEEQMAHTLHFPLDQRQTTHPAFADLQSELNAIQEKGDIDLSMANALWVQKDYIFLKEFLGLIEKHYGATLHSVDFKRACEATRRKINAWVEQKTRNKIKDLIKPDVLDPLTRLVLTNAIYFKGKWRYQFKKDNTEDGIFRPAKGSQVNVPMMSLRHEFKYMENDTLKILELPYIGDDLSMVVLLPAKVDGLPRLEAVLSKEKLNAWIGSLSPREVFVFLPKFKITSQFSLGKTLISMGMSDPFCAKADFSGIDGTKDLFISAVIHKAFVDVGEEGTEAAAATAVVMRLTSAAPSACPVFLADHPFIFLIRDNRTGGILFIGRIINPSV